MFLHSAEGLGVGFGFTAGGPLGCTVMLTIREDVGIKRKSWHAYTFVCVYIYIYIYLFIYLLYARTTVVVKSIGLPSRQLSQQTEW